MTINEKVQNQKTKLSKTMSKNIIITDAEAISTILEIPVEELFLTLQHFQKINKEMNEGRELSLADFIVYADELPVCPRAKLFFMAKLMGWLERNCRNKSQLWP